MVRLFRVFTKQNMTRSDPVLYNKNPIPSENESQETTQGRLQKFDNTTIADRLRAVRWSNYYHQTGMVKPVYGIPTFPLTTKAV